MTALQTHTRDPDANRRQYEREPERTKLTILVPATGSPPQASVRFTFHEAWAHNVSANGVGFLCLAQIPEGPILMHVDIPEVGPTMFEGDVVRSRQLITGLWEYGVTDLTPLSESELPGVLATADVSGQAVPAV